MRRSVTLCAAFGLVLAGRLLALDGLGENMIDCKITLPNGDLYMRGASDPVADLVVKLTLTNKTAKEKFTKEDVEVRKPQWLNEDEIRSTQKMTQEQREAFLKGKVVTKTVQVAPVNKVSLGFAYVPPELGPNDLVEFAIYRQPDEGKEGAKPKLIEREMAVEHTGTKEWSPTAYLPASETTPEFTLPVGRFYKIREPGTYTVKAVLRTIGDSTKPEKVLESNEERFRVLPYKIVSRKVADLERWWADYERGHPDFNYMFYQLEVAAQYQEIYYVQRVVSRGIERWEWHRLCTLAPGASAQVSQVTPTKVAVLAPHYKGDAGLYTVDFAKVDPLVTAQTLKAEAGKVPKLKVEGGNVSHE